MGNYATDTRTGVGMRRAAAVMAGADLSALERRTAERSLREREHRVEIRLRDLRQVVREPREALHEIGERRGVGRRRAAEAAHEAASLALGDKLLGVHVGQRRDSEGCVADQLGEDSAGPDRDERPEDGILDDARQ